MVIVGGGDSAFDGALTLTLRRIAARVTLVHRRATFRAHPATVAGVRAAALEIVGHCEPVRPVPAISQDRRVAPESKDFVADHERFFTEPLPGRDRPLGAPGGAGGLGPVGADTALVAGYDRSGRALRDPRGRAPR
ncbi:hypothetical protein ACWD4G_20845 [Streptomyces sp. NPDC002643]